MTYPPRPWWANSNDRTRVHLRQGVLRRIVVESLGFPRRPTESDMRENQSICPTCGSWIVSVLIYFDEPRRPPHYTCRICSTEWDRDRDWAPSPGLEPGT